jgi:hypothetical protein
MHTMRGTSTNSNPHIASILFWKIELLIYDARAGWFTSQQWDPDALPITFAQVRCGELEVGIPPLTCEVVWHLRYLRRVEIQPWAEALQEGVGGLLRRRVQHQCSASHPPKPIVGLPVDPSLENFPDCVDTVEYLVVAPYVSRNLETASSNPYNGEKSTIPDVIWSWA